MHRIEARADELGECPTWDELSGRLLHIDVIGRRLLSCEPDGGQAEEVSLAEIPGSFALRRNGGLLMAYRRGLALRDPAGNETSIELPSQWDGSRERFNDGSCDALGRFWVGTMDRCLQETVGALYRLNCDLTVHRTASGFGISNGIAWSPDNRTMYHCDSRPPVIYAYEFDLDAGVAQNHRILVDFTSPMGMPDGCATDVEGFIWVAAPGTGQVMRFDPEGVDAYSASHDIVGLEPVIPCYGISVVDEQGHAEHAVGALFLRRYVGPAYRSKEVDTETFQIVKIRRALVLLSQYNTKRAIPTQCLHSFQGEP